MAQNWKREEAILAFTLYCKIPFGQIHSRNKEVIKLAHLLGRTPSSVSMKMGNFGRFDPDLKKRGISGLKNGSKLDELVWNEFHNDWEALLVESKSIMEQYDRLSAEVLLSDDYEMPIGGIHPQQINARINQSFFRNAVLSSYGRTCCITGLNIPNLLIASHIKPWRLSDPATERTNPKNGLCLNALHDKAFDQGLITVSTDYNVMISNTIKDFYMTKPFEEYFSRYDGRSISLPEKFLPEKSFLEFHNANIFKG